MPELELEVLDAGCCGMSGVFGYEADHFELSVAMGERVLLPAVRGAPAMTAVLATGTSCRSQIHDLGGRRALHPLEFLAARIEAAVSRQSAGSRRCLGRCRGPEVNAVILIAGIVGLAIAGYGLIALSIDAWRRRQYLDIALGVAVAVAVVVLLVVYGDSLLR